jgi:hypothetical protein
MYVFDINKQKRQISWPKKMRRKCEAILLHGSLFYQLPHKVGSKSAAHKIGEYETARKIRWSEITKKEITVREIEERRPVVGCRIAGPSSVQKRAADFVAAKSRPKDTNRYKTVNKILKEQIPWDHVARFAREESR